MLVWKNASGLMRNSRPPSCSRSCGTPDSRTVSPPAELSPSWSWRVQKRPSHAHRVDQRVGVDRALGGDEPYLQLAGPAPLADDEVAQQAALLAPVPCRKPLGARPREHLLADGVGALGGEQAVVHRNDLVPAAGRVEPAHQLAAGAVPERVLELVAVSPGLDRGDDRLDRDVAQLADPLERLAHLARLDLELALVRQHLPGSAGMVGGRRDAVRRRLEHLDSAGLGVRALGLADDGTHAVARHRARDEDDVAVEPRDAVPAVGERVDGQLELVAARGAGPGGRGHPDQDDTAGSDPGSHRSTRQPALDRRQDRLAVRVAALVVADRPQLGDREPFEAVDDLGRRQVVVARDRERAGRVRVDLPPPAPDELGEQLGRVVARHPPAGDRVVEHLLDPLPGQQQRFERSGEETLGLRHAAKPYPVRRQPETSCSSSAFWAWRRFSAWSQMRWRSP